MNQIYRFEDWTSAAKMRNDVNPCLRVDVGVLRNSNNGIDGYQLTIYDEAIDTIVYKLFVDVGLPNTWSLTTDEAVEFLNQIGFPCKFNRRHYPISSEVRTILTSVRDLGYTHVYRTIRPAKVIVVTELLNKEVPLHEIIDHYDYHDFWFLDTTPTRIDGILGDTAQ